MFKICSLCFIFCVDINICGFVSVCMFTFVSVCDLYVSVWLYLYASVCLYLCVCVCAYGAQTEKILIYIKHVAGKWQILLTMVEQTDAVAVRPDDIVEDVVLRAEWSGAGIRHGEAERGADGARVKGCGSVWDFIARTGEGAGMREERGVLADDGSGLPTGDDDHFWVVLHKQNARKIRARQTWSSQFSSPSRHYSRSQPRPTHHQGQWEPWRRQWFQLSIGERCPRRYWRCFHTLTFELSPSRQRK